MDRNVIWFILNSIFMIVFFVVISQMPNEEISFDMLAVRIFFYIGLDGSFLLVEWLIFKLSNWLSNKIDKNKKE